jgi:hypothetical protein
MKIYLFLLLSISSFRNQKVSGNEDVPRQRHGPFVRLAQQRPGAFTPLTVTQRPQGADRLPPSWTPAHPRTFQALAHPGVTRGFHAPRAPRHVLRPQGRIAPPVARRTNIGQRCMEGLPTRGARPPATQRSQHGVDPFRRIAPSLASRLYAFLGHRRALTRGRPQRGAELLRRRRDIEPLLTPWPGLAPRTPVVRRSSGHGEDAPVRTLPPRPQHCGGPLPLAGGFLGRRHPGQAPGAPPLALAIILGPRGTAHLLRARWAPGRCARGACVGALGWPLALWPRRHAPGACHRPRHGLVGESCLVAQPCCKGRTVRLPVDTARLGQAISGAVGRRQMPQSCQACLPLLGRQLCHHPGRLRGGHWRPGARHDPRLQVPGTPRPPTAVALPRQAPLAPPRACRTGRGRRPPSDAMVPLPVDVERRHITIAAGSCVAPRFTLRRHQEPMALLCTGRQLCDGLVRGAPLTQKGLELVHSMGITGQEVMTRQGLQRGSPLA